HLAMAAVLEFLNDVPEATAQHVAGRGAAEQAAQSAGEEVTQGTAGLGAGARRHAAWSAAEQSAENIVEPTARSTGTHCAARRHPRPCGGRRAAGGGAGRRGGGGGRGGLGGSWKQGARARP